MKPLNRIERTNAFLRFLLLFIITVGLIVSVVLFSIQVPWKENDRLRRQMLTLQSDKELSESFAKDVRETQLVLAKYENQDAIPAATHESVNNQLNKLRGRIKQLPNGEASLYDLVIVSLSELNDAKKKLRDARPN